MAVKSNFASGDVLTASDVNTYLTNGGLVYVGAATLSTVTNTISNVFSSTYDNYLVKVSGFYSNGTTTRAISLRIGTDATANYTFAQYGIFGATTFNAGATAQTSVDIGSSSNQIGEQSIDLWINSPNLAKPTTISGTSIMYQSNVTAITFRTLYGHHNVSTAYTGFQIIGTTDNLVGTVRVYGYRQA